MGLMTLVPLSNSSLDGYQPYGAEEQPNTQPEQIAPLGAINAEISFAYSRDVSGSFSDPDGDPLTFSNPGNDLPAGLIVNSAGVISGTPTTRESGQYTIRATDPGGLFVDATDFYNIIEASEIPLCANWPNPFISWMVRGWKDVWTDPTAQAYLDISALVVRQGLGKYTQSARLETKQIFQRWRDNNPEGVLLEHHNMQHIDINDPEGSNNAVKQWWDHVFPGQNFDHVIVSANGNPNGRQSGVSMANSIRYSAAISLDAVRQWWVDNVWYANLSDNGDKNPANDGPATLMDFQPGLVHDGMPDVLRKRFCSQQFDGTVAQRINNREIRTNQTYSGTLTGNPDGDGYRAFAEPHFLAVLPNNRSDAAAVHLAGYKEVGGDGYWKAKTDYPGWVASGYRAEAYITKGDTRSADWSDPPNGTNDNQDSPLRRQANLDVFTKVDAITAAYGYEHGINLNGVSGAGISKRSGGGATYPNEYTGNIETAQYESVENNSNFKQLDDHSGYTGANFKRDNLMRDLYYGLTWINTTGPVKNVRLKGVILDCHTRDAAYSEMNELDAAYFRFWLGFCLSTRYTLFGGNRGDSLQWPWTIEESCWLPGGDPARDLGTYDPNGDGGRGVFTFRTPDFGTHGFVTKFPNGWWVGNLRNPDNDPWIPSHLSGGQAINPSTDVWTPEDPGPGKKLITFRGDGYLNPETGWRPHSGRLGNVDLGRDADINNGSDVVGDQNIGALEYRLYEVVDA